MKLEFSRVVLTLVKRFKLIKSLFNKYYFRIYFVKSVLKKKIRKNYALTSKIILLQGSVVENEVLKKSRSNRAKSQTIITKSQL